MMLPACANLKADIGFGFFKSKSDQQSEQHLLLLVKILKMTTFIMPLTW